MTRGIWGLTWVDAGGMYSTSEWRRHGWNLMLVGGFISSKDHGKPTCFEGLLFFSVKADSVMFIVFFIVFFQMRYSKISGWTSCYVLQFRKVYEMTGFSVFQEPPIRTMIFMTFGFDISRGLQRAEMAQPPLQGKAGNQKSPRGVDPVSRHLGWFAWELTLW